MITLAAALSGRKVPQSYSVPKRWQIAENMRNILRECGTQSRNEAINQLRRRRWVIYQLDYVMVFSPTSKLVPT